MTPLDYTVAAAFFAAAFASRLWLNNVAKPWRSPRVLTVTAAVLAVIVWLGVWAQNDPDDDRPMWFVMAITFGMLVALVIGLVNDARAHRRADRRA